MILHPGIIALLGGSLIITSMLAYGSLLGIAILRRWDIASSSEEQLALERKTYLVSSIMSYTLGFEMLSSLVFIYTSDEIHHVLVGAMCATGTMNANPIGWTALSLKLFILFISASWIALNSINNKAEDYPLVKIQYALILFLFPLVLTESWVQLRFFLGLKPDVITSCCGALFTPAGGTLASSLSGLPIRPMMILFFSSFFLLTATGIFAIFHNVKLLLYSFSGMAFFFLFVSIASIISFISLYFYRIPTHHCPFDIFQGQYFYIGYPLYASLLGGVFFGMFAGFAEPLGKIRSLNAIIEKMKAKWIKISLILIFIFMLISAWPIIFSTFTLEGYY